MPRKTGANADARVKTMNVSLPARLHEAVQNRVQSGVYTSASEVVRDALRVLLTLSDRIPDATESPELSQLQWKELRNALAHGERELVTERMKGLDQLYATSLVMMRAQIREEHPEASEAELQKLLVHRIQQRASGRLDADYDPRFEQPVSEERLRRMLTGD